MLKYFQEQQRFSDLNQLVPASSMSSAPFPVAAASNNEVDKNTSNTLNQLSSVLSNHTFTKIENEKTYHMYAGRVDVSTKINGMPQVTNIDITYRIGLRLPRFKSCIKSPEGVVNFNLGFRLNEAFSTELTGIARRYSNFAPKFEVCDYGAILHHLAAAVTFYSLKGALSWSDYLQVLY